MVGQDVPDCGRDGWDGPGVEVPLLGVDVPPVGVSVAVDVEVDVAVAVAVDVPVAVAVDVEVDMAVAVAVAVDVVKVKAREQDSADVFWAAAWHVPEASIEEGRVVPSA